VAQNVKDGLEGLVRLRKEQLTALQDQQFFERVFIHQGADAWPGDGA